MHDRSKRRERMEFTYSAAVLGVLFFVLFVSGCTSTTPPLQTQTPVPTTAAVTLTPTPAPTSEPFPNALALNEYATFGSGNEQGKATVYKFEVKPDYNWTSPVMEQPRPAGRFTAPRAPARLQYGKTPGRKHLPLPLYPRPEYRYQCRVRSVSKTVCRVQ